MDSVGLFYPLSASKFVVKLSNSKGIESDRVFPISTLEKNGGTLKGSNKTITTNDVLGSKDLLVLIQYMEQAGIFSHKNWDLKKEFDLEKTKKNTKIELHESEDFISEEHCILAHDKLLIVCNDITQQLDSKSKELKRLPNPGPAGLIFFLCKSRSILPSGCYRKFCNYNIHHFDPIDSKNEAKLKTNTVKKETTVSKNEITKSTKQDGNPPTTNDDISANKKVKPPTLTKVVDNKSNINQHSSSNSNPVTSKAVNSSTLSNQQKIHTRNVATKSTPTHLDDFEPRNSEKKFDVHVRIKNNVSKEDIMNEFTNRGCKIIHFDYRIHFGFILFDNEDTANLVLLNSKKYSTLLLKISPYQPNSNGKKKKQIKR